MSASASQPSFWGVVPAAGLGERMAGEVPKQYLPLAGRTVISHTLQRMLDWGFLEGLVVALHEKDTWWSGQPLAGDKRVDTVVGGEQRCHSVLAALRALAGRAAPQDWVLVHDAARPCVRREDVARLQGSLTRDTVGGLLALPVAETVKRAGREGRAEATVDRRDLWLAQTPQMFRYGALTQCLQEALDRGEQVTDEASAMELAGLKPLLVAGSATNIKITLPADLATAEAWLALGE